MNKHGNTIFKLGDYAKIYENKDELLAMTPKVLEEETKTTNEKYKLHSLLQNLMAVTALKQSLIEICKFKQVYLTILAKGDDITIIKNIQHCIDQCIQAKQLQYPTYYNFNKLIFINISNFQIFMNECLEHFIEMLKTILLCLKNPGGGNSSVEYFSQRHTWTGWAQNGHMALMSYNCLSRVLLEMEREEKPFTQNEKEILRDMKASSDCFKYIITSYMNKRYPSADLLLEHFQGDNIINKSSLSLLEVDEKSEEKAQGRWNLNGSFFW